eukprot:2052516-Pyramimonas_sp.AAC.1
MAAEELPGTPGGPEFIEKAFRQIEEDKVSDGMAVPVPPAKRSPRVTRAPLQRSPLDDAAHGMQSLNE